MVAAEAGEGRIFHTESAESTESTENTTTAGLSATGFLLSSVFSVCSVFKQNLTSMTACFDCLFTRRTVAGSFTQRAQRAQRTPRTG
jgi:hypothetical protein